MRMTSSISLLGLPLFDIAIGVPGRERRVARGWLAIGDTAFGGVAIGGIAIGGISLGGLSAGALSLAGVSVGVWSVGGVALGAFSLGGLSVALIAATGGLAAASQYAIGGLAIAPHANDGVAQAYFASGAFFRYTDPVVPYLRWIIAVGVAVVALWWTLGSRKARDDRPER